MNIIHVYTRYILRSMYIHMEVASSSNDDVGLVLVLDRFGRGLDVQVSFFLRLWQGGASTTPPVASREE